MNGIAVLGEAISTLSDVNGDSELSKSVEIISLISATANLSVEWAKAWNLDSYNYYIDSLKAVGTEGASALAAADYATYQTDLQQGQNEMGKQDNILQSNKSVLQGLGNALDQVYSLEQVPIQLTKAVNRSILAMGN